MCSKYSVGEEQRNLVRSLTNSLRGRLRSWARDRTDRCCRTSAKRTIAKANLFANLRRNIVARQTQEQTKTLCDPCDEADGSSIPTVSKHCCSSVHCLADLKIPYQIPDPLYGDMLFDPNF
jgi:hypothetical protein